jgi:hypothetical protein
MKACAAKLTLIIAASSLLLVTSCGPPAINNGKEYGYYGDFNRASNALVAIPGIRITNFWLNPDITLEEFGFDVVTQTGQPVRIGFGERDPLRKLSRAQLTAALAAEIRQKTAATNE